ncbi:MAG: redoxin domain-containing protein [Gammaproteobacteria bacterium]|nr:redoxin domain-containing protein [Gammaproteobacteria bacterium]
MNKLNFLKVAVLSVLMLPVAAGAADRVGDFSLLDQDGYFHNMSWYDDHVTIALLVQANDSQDTAAAVPAFTALQAKFADQGVEFMMINPMGLGDRAEVKAKLAEYGVDIPVLMDDSRIASAALGIDKTGEVFLFNPKSFMVDFRGPVAAAEQALTELLAGKEISTPLVATTGSSVSYPVAEMHAKATPSYVNDIAPIIAENCASCHRQGGIAPFAMDSHAMVQGWSPMIREVLMTKRMPPGQIDGHIGEFINDMLISNEEMQKLVHWAEAGAPNDGSTDPLAQLTWLDTKWAFGEPDYIIKVPEQSIPATGVLDYRQVSVPIDIPTDRWVRGSQYVAGDRTVLHHTLNGLVEPGASRRGGFLGGGNPDQATISAYIPGATPIMDPENTGGLLKAGSILNLQLHYTTNGKETVDNSEIGLWFYPEGVVPEERMSGGCACIFTPTWTNIPPNDPNFEQTESITIAKDAYIHSMLPHMHFRGKYMRFYANYPDGTSEELINIANYNYNWQLSYTYKQPKFVPAGTVIKAVGAFDNSAQNSANPDPARSVPWGQQSWDEMFFGAVNWKYADQGGD